MTLTSALAKLRSAGLPVLRSADVAAYLDVSATNASAIMARLAKYGHVARIKRGLWAFADTDPLVIVPHLTAPLPSYISLQSALYYHDMVSQIPEVVFCVSLARTRTYRSPLGPVSVHHIPGSFFFGYEESKHGGVAMASPEKALVDFLYLGPAKSRLFAALPELNLPAGFSKKRVQSMITRIRDRKRRTYVQGRLKELLARSR